MNREWDEREIAIFRDLLIRRWPALSRGERSIIFEAFNSIDHRVSTMAGTAHADFWECMIGLDWAKQYEIDLGVPMLPDFRAFGFNESGLRLFPAFVEQYGLRRLVVNEEQPETLQKVQGHVDAIAAQVALLPWSDLAERLPGGDTHVLIEDVYGYLAAAWDTTWLGESGGPIEIRVRGFLHPGHHKSIYETSRTVHK